ncbi:Protein kinase domain - like 10 [Theobroma cacao]|nr:Protein kinase domain - like 10 [Theobroma cacao]
MKQKGTSDLAGKVVVVAVKAARDIPRTALVWALTHVVQPGDCIKLLVVIPALSSSKKIWGISRFTSDCTTGHWKSLSETSLDQKQDIADSCSQMIFQLQDVYDPEKVKVRVKIVPGSPYGIVAAEAKKAQSNWVILDKRLKHEKKHCLEELQCNLVVMKRSQPKVLRLNLVGSPNMAPEVAWPLSFESEAYPKHKKSKHDRLDEIRGPFVTPVSSPDHESSLTTTDVGTSSISSSDPGASPFFLPGLYESLKKEYSFITEESQNLFESDSGSDSEIDPPKTRLFFEPETADIRSSVTDSKHLGKGFQRLNDSSLTSTYSVLLEKLSTLNREPDVGVGDFGLARWQPDGDRGVETRVIGTFGYLAPEYAQSGQITEKADVYSFGVVLVELITGRKAMDINRPKGQQCLTEWARPLLESHAMQELVDPRLGNCYTEQDVYGMLQCASLCIRRDPHSRPRMSQVGSGAVVGDDLPGHTVIGCNNIIGHHAVVGIKCQDMKYKSGDECFLDVGNNNEIREFTSIHRSSKSSDITVIGDNNLIMGSCHIAHDCKIGNNNIFANNTLLAGHVIVEDHAHTAGASVVHQFCHIGSFAFIGGGSVVSQDVPKYMMVSGERAELRGLNLEGLRRRGFLVTEIKCLRTAYRKIFMPSDTNSMGFDERLAEVIWVVFLLYLPCSSPFVILLLKIVVEYANSDNGAVLESIAGILYDNCHSFELYSTSPRKLWLVSQRFDL